MIEKTTNGKKGIYKNVYFNDDDRGIELQSFSNFSVFEITECNGVSADTVALSHEQFLALADMIEEMKKEMGVR